MSVDASLLPNLRNIATRLRIESIRATTAAGSGHPTTCQSAADLMAALFFAEMRFDPHNPQHPLADRLVMSKGHAAPLLYALWAEAGFIPRRTAHRIFRLFSSDLEGHPTPRLPFVDVATGSLGQGLCAGVGCALNARRIGADYRTYVLLGDGETAEGSVWEAASVGHLFKLDSLCAIVDVNGLGQSRATELDHDMEAHRARWRAFGWHAVVIDGHDMLQVLAAYDEARSRRVGRPPSSHARRRARASPSRKPSRTGTASPEGRGGDARVRRARSAAAARNAGRRLRFRPPPPRPGRGATGQRCRLPVQAGRPVATREAYGTAIAKLAGVDARVVALDADVKNSTFSERFEAAHPIASTRSSSPNR